MIPVDWRYCINVPSKKNLILWLTLYELQPKSSMANSLDIFVILFAFSSILHIIISYIHSVSNDEMYQHINFQIQFFHSILNTCYSLTMAVHLITFYSEYQNCCYFLSLCIEWRLINRDIMSFLLYVFVQFIIDRSSSKQIKKGREREKKKEVDIRTSKCI